MNETEIETALLALCEIARPQTMSRFRLPIDIDDKQTVPGGFDPVTLADRGAEAAIREWLAGHYPAHGILGEEDAPVNPDAAWRWIIDPVDGTRAFISGLPTWGTLIGLMHEGEPVAGVMHQPFTDEIFLNAGSGSKYMRAGDISMLRTSPIEALPQATAMTTSPDIFPDADKPLWQKMLGASRLVRYGCDCYAYAMLAAGHIEIVMESCLHVYDIAPLIPVIRGAGGIVTDWQGNPCNEGGRVLAAANLAIHEQALDLLNG
jgi:myo-inositol-1(or 4)-monophosphatase